MSFSLLRLLHCLLSKSSQVSVAAYTQIRALATTKGLKLQTLFSQYKNPICQVSSLLFKLDQTPSYSPAYHELDDLLYNTVIHSIYVDLMFENCIGLVFIWSVLDTTSTVHYYIFFAFSSWWSHYIRAMRQPCGAHQIKEPSQPIRGSWLWIFLLRLRMLLTFQTSTASSPYVQSCTRIHTQITQIVSTLYVTYIGAFLHVCLCSGPSRCCCLTWQQKQALQALLSFELWPLS